VGKGLTIVDDWAVVAYLLPRRDLWRPVRSAGAQWGDIRGQDAGKTANLN
jgi:hypothetical protein